MKDKLRELVGELMSACEMIGYAKSGNERANHRATRDKTKAELLAILDGDGDGGAVAWMSPNKERLEFSRPDTVYGSHTIPLYTHPARSGVVSDEDVRDRVISNSTVAKARDAYNNALVGVAISQISAMRAALLAVWPSVDKPVVTHEMVDRAIQRYQELEPTDPVVPNDETRACMREIISAALAAQGQGEAFGWVIPDGEGGYFFRKTPPSDFDREWADKYNRHYTPVFEAPPAPPAGVPDGETWVLVPREPTDEMLKAAYPLHWFDSPGQRLKHDYKAMLTAAPQTGEFHE